MKLIGDRKINKLKVCVRFIHAENASKAFEFKYIYLGGKFCLKCYLLRHKLIGDFSYNLTECL